MFRGFKAGAGYKSEGKVVKALLILALVGTSQSAMGRSMARQDDAITGKLVAPNLEDHASYFSSSRQGVSISDLIKADKLRRKTIVSIQALLDSNKTSIRRFELLLRLGELHAERHDFLRDIEMGRYGEAFDKWAALPEDKRGPEPELNLRASTGELTRAANSFRRLVNEFPRHPRTDAALYSLAKTLARLGKSTSVNYYKQLLRTHPKSPLVPDTYLALGEYYFDKHQIDEAIGYYKKVMGFKNHKAYPYAVYKLGWAYYNANATNDKQAKYNHRKAITAFKLVVKLAELDKERSNRNLSLRDEAIRDLIMVWADAEDVSSAWSYFKTIDEQASFYKMLERLGHIYFEQGKNSQAIAVYRRLLKDAPRRANNPEIHAKLLELYDLTNKISSVVAELGNMQKLYIGKTVWVAANRKDRDVIQGAEKLVERNMHRYGALFHQRGIKAKNKTYLKSAASIYAMYLDTFPQSKNSYDIRYYLAEILFDFKQFETASEHYMRVAKADPKGQYHKPAALNGVGTINQLVNNTKFAKLPPAGQVPKPLPIPAAKNLLIKRIDEYVEMLPKEKDGHAMRYTAAYTFFEYGHYPQAIKRFEKITKEIPQTKQAKASVRLILAYHADKEDWDGLIAWSKSFSSEKDLLDNDLRNHVVDLLRNALFKRALAYEKAGQFEKAARSFVEYQKEFPKDKNADRALYNATLSFYKVGQVEAALEAGKVILTSYPKSNSIADTLVNMAMTYEALAQFKDAAHHYQKLAIGYPKDKRAAGAMYNAAILYKGLNNNDIAADLFGRFIKTYPNDKGAPDAAIELAGILEKQERYKDAIDVYELYARRYDQNKERALYAGAKAATLKTFHVSLSKGNRDLERIRRKLVAKNAPVAYDARRELAKALFRLAEPTFTSFQSIQLTDGSRIEKLVQMKQGKLVNLAKAYENIIELGSAEYSVAALYRLGEAHENFSRELFKAPAPQGSSQAVVDAFKTELEKVAFPLQNEAYKFYETAYKRSQEVQTFTVWTRKTYEKMVELAPEKHPALEELAAEPSYLEHDIKISAVVSNLVER